MTEKDFYLEMNKRLQSWGISQSRIGYQTFIRVSYRKYKNPSMKLINDGGKTNYKPYFKILSSIINRGKYKDYSNFISQVLI